MKRILTYCPNHLDGISFYRMHGPLGELEKKELIKVTNYRNTLEDLQDWTYFTKNDIVFISRPSLKIDMKFLEVARDYGLKIWSDFDDNLIHLPDDNDVFLRFMGPEGRKAIDYTIHNSDVVTVASDFHKRILEKEFGHKNVITIPNAIPPWYLKFKKPFQHSKKVCWRGTASHLPELLFHESEMKDLIEKYDFDWLFLGVNPYFVTRKLEKNRERVSHSKGMPAIDFIKALCHYNAAFHFVPLIDSKFHRSKSNLAWMDATLAGSVVLGPDFEEWKRPGLLNYRAMSKGDFWTQMVNMLKMHPEELKKSHDLSWQWILDNIQLDHVNKIRVQIINGI